MSVLTLAEAAAETRRARERGLLAVTTNGCFDLLHVGHIRYLEFARAQGDLLIAGVNSDASVRRLKGADRPVVPAAERAELLDALASVSHAVIFEEDTPTALIEALRPAAHVKGGDYRMEQIVERSAVERFGGRVILSPRIDSPSTTDRLAAIARRFAR